MKIEFINPPDLHQNPAFSHGFALAAETRTLFIGGQNAIDAEGAIVGKGDVGAQPSQALLNLNSVLRASGTALRNVAKLTIYLVGDADLQPAFGAWMKLADRPNPPPVISVIRVLGLSHPDFLVEIEGLAAFD